MILKEMANARKNARVTSTSTSINNKLNNDDDGDGNNNENSNNNGSNGGGGGSSSSSSSSSDNGEKEGGGEGGEREREIGRKKGDSVSDGESSLCWWGSAPCAPCCFLDIRHRGSTYLQRRFPSIFAHCLSKGLDMGIDLLPVVPAAHYFCGGVAVDLEGRTSVPGLFAAGEVRMEKKKKKKKRLFHLVCVISFLSSVIENFMGVSHFSFFTSLSVISPC
jgi:hypothetical protein